MKIYEASAEWMKNELTNTSVKVRSTVMSTLSESKTQKAKNTFHASLESVTEGNTGLQKDKKFLSETKMKNVDANKRSGTLEDRLQESQGLPQETKALEEDAKALEAAALLCQQPGITQEVHLSEDFVDCQGEVTGLTSDYVDLQNTIMELLSDRLGISEEDLLAAMESLGITAMDVCEPANLTNLVVMLDGEMDISTVLTDESLYTQLKGITEELNLLTSDFTEEQLLQLEQDVTLLPGNDVTEVPDVNKDVHVQSAKQSSTDVHGNESEVAEGDEAVIEITVEDKQGSLEGSKEQKGAAGNESFREFVNQMVMNAGNDNSAAASEVLGSSQTDMESIIRQLVEQVKIQVKADTTSMEMQLYPESYGKLNLHVAVKDGVVTAQLAVENETARRAIESQVVQLKESMNDQGLKVDAVEVTIESHEFERSLDQGQGQSFDQEQSKAARRNINLNDDGPESDIMETISEEEDLTRRIMLQNGNRFNYSV